MQREEREKQEEEQRKKEIKEYIDDFNALKSKYLSKIDLNNYDEYMSLPRDFITEILFLIDNQFKLSNPNMLEGT